MNRLVESDAERTMATRGFETGSRMPMMSLGLRVCIVMAGLHIGMLAVGQCNGLLGQRLDLALQQVLVEQYEAPEGWEGPGPGSGSPIDCLDWAEGLARDNADRLPPSIGSPLIEQRLGRPHERWYLLSLPESAFHALRCVWQEGEAPETCVDVIEWLNERDSAPFMFGDVIHAFDDLDTFLINASSIAQFAQMLELLSAVQDDMGDPRVHLMENYPMVPAMQSAANAVALNTGRYRSEAGNGFAIAILDTGVSRAAFGGNGGRIVYEACFSSNAILLVDEVEGEVPIASQPTSAIPGARLSRQHEGLDKQIFATSLCDEGHTDDLTWSLVYQRYVEHPTAYAPMRTLDGDGEPCQGLTHCRHGTSVALVAAGLEGDGITHAPLDEPGVATQADIISIQVHSRVPSDYCATPSKGDCAVTMPLDVLRALKHLETEIGHGANVLPRFALGYVVAANLSYQLEEWCVLRKGERDFRPCVGEAPNTQPQPPSREDSAEGIVWRLSHYDRPCENPFAVRVRQLQAKYVHSVIAAGNQDEINPGPLGYVSLPGCVQDAVTVGAMLETNPRRRWGRSKLSCHVDVFAPGYNIRVSPLVDRLTGTSIAAPFVAGALARVRESRGLPSSSAEFLDEIDDLMAGSVPVLTDGEWDGGPSQLDIGLYFGSSASSDPSRGDDPSGCAPENGGLGQ